MTKPSPSDYGTPERAQHGDKLETQETTRAGVRQAVNRTQAVLDRYYCQNLLGEMSGPVLPNGMNVRNFERWQEGIWLRGEIERAGLQPTVTTNYGEWISGGGVEFWASGCMDARKRYRDAIKAVGPIASKEVIEVCWLDKPVGRERMEILRRGLEILARHRGH